MGLPSPAFAQTAKTLSFARTIDVFNWDPFNQANGNFPIMETVFEPLFDYDERVKPLSRLALSWAFNADHTEMTLKLRGNVKFQSGRPFGADDVIYTLNRAKDPKTGVNMSAFAAQVKDATARDKTTVVLNFDRPFAPIFDLLTAMAIVDRDTADNFKEHTIGTGPFMRDSWTPGDRAVLKKNPAYWNAGHPYLDAVELHVVPDAGAMVAAVQSGQSQLADSPPSQIVASMQHDANIKYYDGGAGSRGLALLLNVTQPPFDNPKVRQAMNWAIDRDRIARVVLAGLGKTATLPWADNSLAYDAALAKTQGFNLDRARALLKSAGLANGFSATLTASAAIEPERLAAAQIIASDLAKIGVQLTIDDPSAIVYRGAYVNGTFQMAVHTFSNLNVDPGGIELNFGFRPGGSTHYDAPEYRHLLLAGSSEFDPGKRRAIYHDLGALMLRESFACMIAHRGLPYLVRRSVNGFVTSDYAYPRLGDVTIA